MMSFFHPPCKQILSIEINVFFPSLQISLISIHLIFIPLLHSSHRCDSEATVFWTEMEAKCVCSNQQRPCCCFLGEQHPTAIALNRLLLHLRDFWNKRIPASASGQVYLDNGHLQLLSRLITHTCPIADGKTKSK